MAEESKVNPEEKERTRGEESILYQLREIDRFMSDPALNEICINKPGQVITEGNSSWQIHDCPVITYQWCYDLGKLVANHMSVSLGPQSPSVSAELPGGQRIQIVIAPRVGKGRISITIRKPAASVKTLEQFMEMGAFDCTRHELSLAMSKEERRELEQGWDEGERELYDLLREKDYKAFFKMAVEQKRNIVISGATGAGKTTLANSIVSFIPEDERIITVEDVPEIRLPHIENLVPCFFSKQSAGGIKAVFEDTLRMRPDRVLPAELRGDETYFFLQNVLNSGHPGAVTTCHANRTKLAFLRLALMIQSSPEGRALSFENIMGLLHSLIDIVVQIVRNHDRSRSVTEIYFDPAYARKQMG